MATFRNARVAAPETAARAAFRMDWEIMLVWWVFCGGFFMRAEFQGFEDLSQNLSSGRFGALYVCDVQVMVSFAVCADDARVV
jgi:hypothetical protein